MLVLCSNSSGTRNNTTAALYLVTYDGTDVSAKYITGSSGCSKNTEPDIWTFMYDSKTVVVVCKNGDPCRYAFVSNDDTKHCEHRDQVHMQLDLKKIRYPWPTNTCE